MTREEAIAELKLFKGHTFIKTEEAIDMAIKVLEQVSEIEENIIKYMKKYPNHVGNTDFWEGFYACRNVVLQLENEYLPKEQEPCGDSISRQNIIDTYESCADMLSDEELEGANLVMEWIYNAQSVSSQETTGNWEWLTEDKYRCSNCNHETRVDECMNKPMYDFCPFCKARMVVQQESEVRNE